MTAPLAPDITAADVLQERAREVATLLKLMANEQRLILLCRLREGEAAVGELVELCDLSQSSVSQHLARLRDAGLVTTRREQTTIYYSIASAEVQYLLDCLCERFGKK